MADKMLFLQLQVNLNRAMSGFSYHVKRCCSSGPLDCSTAFDCLVVIEQLCCVTCAEGIRAVYSANRCPALWCAYNVTGLHLSLVNIADYPAYLPCTDNFAFANAFLCRKGRFGSLQNLQRNSIDPSGKSLSVAKGLSLQHPVLQCIKPPHLGRIRSALVTWTGCDPILPHRMGEECVKQLLVCVSCPCAMLTTVRHICQRSLCPQSLSWLVPSTTHS